MSELETTKSIARRTVLKGAAWSVPVVAAAAAMPVSGAAVSNVNPSLRIDSGCFQILGVGVLPGFKVSNTGTGPYAGDITIIEKVDLSAIKLDPQLTPPFFNNNGALSSTARSVLWTELVVQSGGGLLEGHDSGVTVSSWTGSGGDNWIAAGVFQHSYKVATRTIHIPAGLAASGTKSWGQLISANLSQLLGGTWTATITNPTGNPPVVKAADNLPIQILGGC